MLPTAFGKPRACAPVQRAFALDLVEMARDEVAGACVMVAGAWLRQTSITSGSVWNEHPRRI